MLGIKSGLKGCEGLFSKIRILILDGQILMPFLLFMPSKYPKNWYFPTKNQGKAMYI